VGESVSLSNSTLAFSTRPGVGILFQLAIMGGCDDTGVMRHQMIQQGFGKRRASAGSVPAPTSSISTSAFARRWSRRS